jgi:hypothetical protein
MANSAETPRPAAPDKPGDMATLEALDTHILELGAALNAAARAYASGIGIASGMVDEIEARHASDPERDSMLYFTVQAVRKRTAGADHRNVVGGVVEKLGIEVGASEGTTTES